MGKVLRVVKVSQRGKTTGEKTKINTVPHTMKLDLFSHTALLHRAL
uniref:Uncharacterized protein n=1 Tax=Anguilla anguilla TaxID=7936 RepID=A0A0E9VVV4_ANGAN